MMTTNQLKYKGVTMFSFVLECDHCHHRWQVQMKRGFRLPNRYWQCANCKSELKAAPVKAKALALPIPITTFITTEEFLRSKGKTTWEELTEEERDERYEYMARPMDD
jgi:hypothetical protein